MTVIEKHIHEHFARLAESGGNTEEPTTNGGPSNGRAQQPVPEELSPAFAKVNSVVAGSPADSAGLKAGDEIRNFGYVNIRNHDGLKRVAECVQGNEGVSPKLAEESDSVDVLQQNVLVKVSRQRRELSLILTPRRDWGGRGLLGCHILPL